MVIRIHHRDSSSVMFYIYVAAAAAANNSYHHHYRNMNDVENDIDAITAYYRLTGHMVHHDSCPSTEEYCLLHNLHTTYRLQTLGFVERYIVDEGKRLLLLANNTLPFFEPPISPAWTRRRCTKKPRRMLSEYCYEPTDNDILFGRGSHTNTHPGNIRFRNMALELRPWYESANNKHAKYKISVILMQDMQAEKRRFLEKSSSDGLWHEVDDNGARHKASQQLRERESQNSLATSSAPNKDDVLPLFQLAMKAGRRYAIALLLMKYPEAVHKEERFGDVKLFGHLLSCLSDKVVMKRQVEIGNPQVCFSTMFQLLRARPDIISTVEITTPETQDGGGGDYFIEPTDNDILFGRGWQTNTHPGNIRFRNMVLELRPWYERIENSTRAQKFELSVMLIDVMKNEKRRFLEKSSSDGLWHEVEDNRARKKASWHLRERSRSYSASSAPNKDDVPPLLQLAMKAGRRYAIALLLMKYPEAVHKEERFGDVKLFGHLLSCLSDKVVMKRQVEIGNPQVCFSTMFQLLRARPDIIISTVEITTPETQYGGVGGDSSNKKTLCGQKRREWICSLVDLRTVLSTSHLSL